MFAWMRNLFRRAVPAMQTRASRWESAQTDRLNENQWRHAQDRDLNLDLEDAQTTLRERCAYELSNNAFVSGIVDTYTEDVVGEDGPMLQVRTTNRAYAEAFEAAFAQWWWSNPESTGELTGPECIELWVRGEFTDGEYIIVFNRDESVAGPIKLQLQMIQPRRMVSPMGRDAERIVLGVKRTREGKAVSYFIEDDDVDLVGRVNLTPVEISADRVEHGFRKLEPNQVRGVPILAPTLQVTSDVREYDKQVLDAARQAADNAVLLTTSHHEASFVPMQGETDIKRRTIATMPPGWEATQLKPEQPQTQYASYRDEKLTELGRCVNMPLMMVKLDSSGHNYSSARFDGQLYQRGVRGKQRWLQRGTLRRIMERVQNELQLAAMLPEYSEYAVLANIPDDVQFHWTWPAAPHVDPSKEATAAETRLTTTTSTIERELAATGEDFETHVETLAREIEAYDAIGVTHPAMRESPQPQDAATATAEEDEDAQSETPAGRFHTNGVHG